MILGSLHSALPLRRYKAFEFRPSSLKNSRGAWPTLDKTEVRDDMTERLLSR